MSNTLMLFGCQETLEQALANCNNGNHNQALTILKSIVEQHPENYQALFLLGLEYFHLHELDAAVQCYQCMVTMYPQCASAWYNLAYISKQCANYKQAYDCYEKALQLDPENDKFHFGASTIFLLLGDYEKGLYSFEKGRPESANIPKRLRSLENIQGKTIMLIEEWGMGDTFQFIRYAPLLKKMGATIAVCARKSTQKILSLCPYITHILTFSEEYSFHVDYQITMPSLMHLFTTRLDAIPTPIPYLYADSHLQKFWQSKINAQTINVGINWKGSGTEKDIPIALFKILLDIPGVTFYSLQKDGHTDLEKNNMKSIIYFDSGFDTDHGNFMDTAALMQHLDLIITMDTSIAHLSGALGKQTWVLLPFIPDWRWGHQTSESKWYPSMRLFRQPQKKDWESLLNQVKIALHSFIEKIQHDKK